MRGLIYSLTNYIVLYIYDDKDVDCYHVLASKQGRKADTTTQTAGSPLHRACNV